MFDVVFTGRQSAFVVKGMAVVVAIGLTISVSYFVYGKSEKSKLNEVIKQIKSIENGARSFKDLNNSLPGDTRLDRIINFTNRAEQIDISNGFALNRGDGDGIIEFGYGSEKKNNGESEDCLKNGSDYINESSSAMYQLYYGGYIGKDGYVTDVKSNYSIRADFNQLQQALPSAKLNDAKISFFGITDATKKAPVFKIGSGVKKYKGNALVLGSVINLGSYNTGDIENDISLCSKVPVKQGFNFIYGAKSTISNFFTNLGLFFCANSILVNEQGVYCKNLNQQRWKGLFVNNQSCQGLASPCVSGGMSSLCGLSDASGNLGEVSTCLQRVSNYSPSGAVLSYRQSKIIDEIMDDGNSATGFVRSVSCEGDVCDVSLNNTGSKRAMFYLLDDYT